MPVCAVCVDSRFLLYWTVGLGLEEERENGQVSVVIRAMGDRTSGRKQRDGRYSTHTRMASSSSSSSMATVNP